MATKTKAAGLVTRAASKNTLQSNCIGSTFHAQTRLPAYARDLLALRRSGRTVPYLIISIGWDLGRALPRVVIPADADAVTLDLGCVRGLDCMVVHRGESARAFCVAERALQSGANRCPVFDAAAGALEATTDDVLAVRGRLAA